MFLETHSLGLTKALAASSYSAPSFSVGRFVLDAEPAGDGVYPCGDWNRLLIMPYCEGPAGSTFWMRLISWRKTIGDHSPRLWLGSPLATFICAAGNLPGLTGDPPPDHPDRVVGTLDNFCSGISIASGSLGAGSNAGQICAYSDGVAFLTIDLIGSQKFQLDFAQAERNNVLMNAFWARA